MYLIEYLIEPLEDAPAVHSELALGTTLEEAIDQADRHLTAAAAKYNARGYRIVGANKVRVAIGPQGHLHGPE